MPLTTPPLDVFRGPTLTSVSMIGAKARLFGVSLSQTSTAWPTANTAILIPFVIGTPMTFVEMFFQAGTSPGTANYDLGIYNDSFTRLVSLGATAAVNTSSAILPVGGGSIGPITLQRGRYYVAMSAAATTITVQSGTQTNGMQRAYGCLSMALAHPLPTTITPAQGVSVIPAIGLTTLTNSL